MYLVTIKLILKYYTCLIYEAHFIVFIRSFWSHFGLFRTERFYEMTV